MASTIKIKTCIEPYLRQFLEEEVFPGHRFQERKMLLTGGGLYKADAVSEDESIVVVFYAIRVKQEQEKRTPEE